jgi:hypothetical protein
MRGVISEISLKWKLMERREIIKNAIGTSFQKFIAMIREPCSLGSTQAQMITGIKELRNI